MSSIIKDRSKKIGKPPGVLIPVGDIEGDQPQITLVDFDEEACSIESISSIEESMLRVKSSSTSTWIDVRGLSDV